MKIRKKLERLALTDDYYILNDVITIDEVREFEAENNIKLPKDYVWFITNVGNGGTWDDGVRNFYPLKEADFLYEGLPERKRGKEKNALSVFSKGCSYSLGIILTGEHFGEISNNSECLAYYQPKMKVDCFKEFYIKWLDEILLGYSPLFVEMRH